VGAPDDARSIRDTFGNQSFDGGGGYRVERAFATFLE
jgi:hypothetical protein